MKHHHTEQIALLETLIENIAWNLQNGEGHREKKRKRVISFKLGLLLGCSHNALRRRSQCLANILICAQAGPVESLPPNSKKLLSPTES